VLVWARGETRWIPGATLWITLAWAALVLSGLGTLLLVWMIVLGCCMGRRSVGVHAEAPPP